MWRSEPVVGITWEDGKTTRETTGTVVLALPRPDRPEDPPDRWAFPDLALVSVPAARKASCVRLSERPPVPPTSVGLHGWSRETGELGIRHVHGTLIGSDGQALVTDWVMPVEGCSGGPVVDHAQGAVVGLNKGRGRDGGAVVPVTALRRLHDLPGGEAMGEALRAHDRYHLARYRSLDDRPDWTRAQRLLPAASGVSPGLRTQLYGHFAELPVPTAPGEIMDLIDQVKAWIRDDDLPDALEDDPRTWSEGAGLLRGLRAPRRDGVRDLDLDAVLLYAAHVVRHVSGRYGERADTAGLTRWIVDESGDADRHLRREIDRLVTPGRPAPLSVRESRARADVLLEIDTPAGAGVTRGGSNSSSTGTRSARSTATTGASSAPGSRRPSANRSRTPCGAATADPTWPPWRRCCRANSSTSPSTPGGSNRPTDLTTPGRPPSASAGSSSSATPGATTGNRPPNGASAGRRRRAARCARPPCAPRSPARARTPTPRACAGRPGRRRTTGSARPRAAPSPSTAARWAPATDSWR